MLNLFIFKVSSRATQYGIGTYIRELIGSLLKSDKIRITLVSYRSSDFKEVTFREVSEGFYLLDIPEVFIHPIQNKVNEAKYANVAVRILSEYIPIRGNVIFQMNYMDDLQLAKKLKEQYPYPIISVVHTALYQQLFEGNIKNITGLNIDCPTNNYEYTLSLEKEFYSISSQVVSVTSYMKDFLVQYYHINPEKISIIHNGIDYKQYKKTEENERLQLRNKLGFHKNDVIILFSGRIDRCKGVDFLLESFQAACLQIKNLRLVLLGNGDIKKYQLVLKSDNSNVTFTGFLNKEQVNFFYKISDLGIVPSIYDHCPYTVLEMIANRLPIIMSRIPGLNEMLNDFECLFTDPIIGLNGEIVINIEELTGLIVHLAQNADLRQQLAAKSYEKLKKRFTSEIMSDSMKAIFDILCKI